MKYIYLDFEGYKGYRDLFNYLISRKNELLAQGFSSEEVDIIIFEDSNLKRCIIDSKELNTIRNIIKKHITCEFT